MEKGRKAMSTFIRDFIDREKISRRNFLFASAAGVTTAALPGVFRRGENAGDGKVQLPDAVQRVVDTLQFQRKLLLIIHMAQRAAAAAGVCRAVRLCSVR